MIISRDFSLCPQTSPFGACHFEPPFTLHLGVSHHASSTPLYPIQPSVSTFEKSHPIKKDVPYQLWNLMKQGVIVFYDDAVHTDGVVRSPDNCGNNSKNFLLVLLAYKLLLAYQVLVKRHKYQPCSVFYTLQGTIKT